MKLRISGEHTGIRIDDPLSKSHAVSHSSDLDCDMKKRRPLE